MARQYKVISADSHLEVDSKHWIHRVPEQYRDRAPRIIRMATGGDAWVIEGVAAREVPSDLYGGKGRDKWRPWGQTYEGTLGTGTPAERIKTQDVDGIDAEVMYPCMVGGPNLWRNIKDDAPYKAVVRGYNDWLAEEYCAYDRERLIGLGVIPMTNINDALAELHHVKKLGLHGALLGAFPSNKGYPSPDDDKFWAASLDMDMPVTIHVELNRSGARSGPLMLAPKAVDKSIEVDVQVDFPSQVSRFHRVAGLNAVQMLLDGLFDRFPTLKVYMAETHAGWIPFFYHMADLRYDRHHWWAEDIMGYKKLQKLPSEYMKEHMYWGILDDPIGVEMRHHVGVDKIMWSTDFPHQESDYPDSLTVLNRIFKGVPDNERHMMVAGNCVKFFHLDR
ncbi:MAG: amidohydrolase [Dehalococcoidia bacterium]|nr:amidohydrolase [Dehalococcoidia bacterium]